MHMHGFTRQQVDAVLWTMMHACRAMRACVQAGVALGLARMVAVRFPDWGPHFQTLMAAVIIVNLCVGPPLFRHAILAAGEGRGQHRDDSLHGSPAPPADAAHGLAVEP